MTIIDWHSGFNSIFDTIDDLTSSALVSVQHINAVYDNGMYTTRRKRESQITIT